MRAIFCVLVGLMLVAGPESSAPLLPRDVLCARSSKVLQIPMEFLFRKMHFIIMIVNDLNHRYWLANSLFSRIYLQPSHKSLRLKLKLAKAANRNQPVPQWVRLKRENAVRYNSKRRHWRRTKLGI
eukprot:TRINITY_DN186_c0_g1_i2.p1 TRINITY_DN186_c0_g1~~TRINITY_DN186_c0_g1_i2.p1  ORF type:complete len:126 (-),score=23.27 TRINITY_DN186_c0_g1_i2:138-515(-)